MHARAHHGALTPQVGGSGDDPCMHALTTALAPTTGWRARDRIEHASRQAETSESGGRGRISSQVALARLSEEFVVVHPKTVAVRVADGH